MAIMNSGPKNGRQPPKSIASKYSAPDKGAPESKNAIVTGKPTSG